MFRRNPRALSVMLLVAAGACSESMNAPEVDTAPPVLFSHTTGGTSHTYDFEDCDGPVAMGPYQDLEITGAMLATCVETEGDTEVEAGIADPLQPGFVGISFPSATAVTADFTGLTVTAIGTGFLTLLESGVTVEAPEGGSYFMLIIGGVGSFDDLVLGSAGEAVDDPETRDACKDGNWEALGFRNQGQCIRFVNTGQDSRTEDVAPAEHPRGGAKGRS